MSYVVDSVAALLAAFIGFSSHRASLCTVKAVTELLNSRRGFLLASFGKATVWAALVFGTLLLFFPSAARGFQAYEPRIFALLGAFLFGIGAALNGGCSLSTLQRLADGDLWMLLTLAGICAGILAWSIADVSLGLTYAIHVPVLWPQLGSRGPWLLAILWLLGAWELARLWQSRPRDLRIWQLPASAAYRLSTAAVIIGVCGGLLYGLEGGWTYSNYFRTAVDAVYRGSASPSRFQALLFAALLAGMVASALQRGSFRWRWSGTGESRVKRFVAGTIMGFGAAAIPGGNDTLLLTGIPTLSGWALGSYLALLLGVAFVLVTVKLLTGETVVVECAGDLCRQDVLLESLRAQHSPHGPHELPE